MIARLLHFWTCERGHRNSDNSMVCLVCLLGVR
jgi:hypothetical protein